MIWLLILIDYKSLAIRFLEKLLTKSAYLEGTEIWVLQERWISRLRLKLAKKAIWSIKISALRSRIKVANSFFSIDFTCPLLRKNLVMIYNLHINSQLVKLILMLLKVRKNISKTIIIVMSANKNFFSTNWNFLFLSLTEKKPIIIPKISSLLLSIFSILTSFFKMSKPSFFVKLGYIGLILLPKLIKVFIKCWSY